MCVYLPYKLIIEGGITVSCGLQRKNLITGLSISKGGQLRVNVWNSSHEVIQLTPKAILVNIFAAEVSAKFLTKDAEKLKDIKKCHILIGGGSAAENLPSELQACALEIEKRIRDRFPSVGDLSSHPVTTKMQKLVVKKEEISWDEPTEWGTRTQYNIEKIADRRIIEEQLDQYIQRGYLKEVSIAETVYFSPLLPIKKPNGTYRFTNDFRKLNKYFKDEGTAQVDVWRKMWELQPTWRYYMKIDLKDGFFGIPVNEELSKLFGFSFGSRRFRWVRLPQGWLWSPILFGERIAEILRGLETPQYSDDVLIGAETPDELYEKAIKVFGRFDEFGVKVNYDKVVWIATEIKFLGYEIKEGRMGLRDYIQKKKETLGEIKTVKDIERVIGIISYARKTIRGTEKILSKLRQDLKELKKGKVSDQWFDMLDSHVNEAFAEINLNMEQIVLPGQTPQSFVLETDWSGDYSGYMLFAVLPNGEKSLVDLGSKKNGNIVSSYLGELEAIVWACKKTKAYRGDIPLTLKTDSHSIFDKYQAKVLIDNDVRSIRRWGWLLANEPGFKIEFYPGANNSGADLLSRPTHAKLGLEDMVITKRGIEKKNQHRICSPVNIREKEVLKVIKTDPAAILPKRMSPGAAGYDIYGIEDVDILKYERKVIRTGISLEMPEGVYGRIAPRSGLTVKGGLNIGAGVIDSDYTGEIKVVMFNHSDKTCHIKQGDRIAQLLLECVKTPEVVEIKEQRKTSRGKKGFGSTNMCGSISEQDLEQMVWDEHLKAHWGSFKTYMALKRNGIKVPYRIVEKICKTCEICTKFRPEVARSKWHPVLYSENPGEIIHMDVIGPLPTGRGGFRYIHCIVDSATRLSQADKLKLVNSAKIISILKEWIKRKGIIGTLVTDNASYYTSEELQQWCDKMSIQHRFIAPYRHQSMGLVERYNRTIEDRIRKLLYAHGGSWVDYVKKAEYEINNAVNSTTGFTPTELWWGTKEMRKMARERADRIRDIRNQNKRVFPASFYTGQMVLIRENNPEKQRKFDRKWKGPYVVKARISKTMWSVQKGRRGQIAIVHEDQMQPFDL